MPIIKSCTYIDINRHIHICTLMLICTISSKLQNETQYRNILFLEFNNIGKHLAYKYYGNFKQNELKC